MERKDTIKRKDVLKGKNVLMGKNTIKTVCILCIVAFLMSGCGQADALPEKGKQSEQGMQDPGNGGTPLNGTFPDGGQAAETISLEELERLDITDMFTDRDWESEYDESEAIEILLNGNTASCAENSVEIEDSTITITEEGTYVLSGKLDNGSIVVDAGEQDKLQLVLKGVDITCATSAAIYVKEADKVFITLADASDNHLAVTGEFASGDENKIDATIFSQADLTLNGAGALNVETAKGHGIVTKDDLVIMDGNYAINVSDKGISGKDSVRIANGNFVINAGDDGIYSEHDDDYAKGFVYIENGNYTISAVGDGIHAGAWNVIVNGNILIKECEEGIEGANVDIRGGNITLTSTDDGINASIPDQFEADAEKIGCYICISGGNVDVTAAGDGVDANGNLYVFDGVLQISGPERRDNGSIDYDGVGQITGGVVVAAGSGGMAQNFSSSSTQGALVVNLKNSYTAGTEVKLENAEGKVLVNITPKIGYNCVIISCPELKVGETYSLVTGSESQEIEMTDLLQGGDMHGGPQGGPPGERGGANGNWPGNMPEDMHGILPEGGHPDGMPEDMPEGIGSHDDKGMQGGQPTEMPQM